MPQHLALFICILFILVLFIRDRKLRPMTSWGLWIPLLWIVIIATRPVSFWFGGGLLIERPEDYLEGSPVDRNMFLLLLVVGLVVLLRRRVNLGTVFASSRWFFVFFFYCLISVIWSDYPFVSFKRWTKELGNVVMVLIIITELDHVQAFRAVLARSSYFVVPLSVVFIKYFPDLGRYYDRWTWQPAYCGVTTNKNELGSIIFVCGLFLFWDLIEMRTRASGKRDMADLMGRVVLLLMVFWLAREANSSTALVCLFLGTGILLFTRRPFARRQVRHLGTYSLGIGLLILLMYFVPSINEAFVGMVGRDPTLTGRTDLWDELLKEPINPLLGTGYQSFWLGPRAKHIWEKYSFHPNQAHNGYLETYLNGGVVALLLLAAMIISTGSKLKEELLLGSSYGIVRFSFLVAAVFYNWTEALFSKLSLVWIILLIATLSYRPSSTSMRESMAQRANGNPSGTPSKQQSRAPAP